MRTYVVIVLFLACAINALSQQLSSQMRTQAIAEAFTKHKNTVKEKYGVKKEKYKDVRSEPVVKQNPGDYSGTYEVAGLGYVLNIQVGNDGRVQANGYENSQQQRSFRLENAKLEGALLTASKVYQDGTTEKFEGVFLSRTERHNPNDAGVTALGLGVILAAPVQIGGITYDKLFYHWKQ